MDKQNLECILVNLIPPCPWKISTSYISQSMDNIHFPLLSLNNCYLLRPWQTRTHCCGHKICVRNKCCARGQTGKHLCRQQCVLVCQHLYVKLSRYHSGHVQSPNKLNPRSACKGFHSPPVLIYAKLGKISPKTEWKMELIYPPTATHKEVIKQNFWIACVAKFNFPGSLILPLPGKMIGPGKEVGTHGFCQRSC